MESKHIVRLVEWHSPQSISAHPLLHLLHRAHAARHFDAAAVAPAVRVVLVLHPVLHHHDIAILIRLPFDRISQQLLVAHLLHRGYQAAEQEVLHHRQLPQDLGHEHLAHALLDLQPVARGADVVEHGAVPAQALDVLDAVDEGHLVEVEVVLGALLEDQRAVDGFGADVPVPQQLRGAEQERQELVVVEPPHAVRAGRLEVVRHLHPAHEHEVAREYAQDELREGGARQQRELVEAQQPAEEVELVPRPVVDARRVAEAAGEVERQLGDGARVRHAHALVPRALLARHPLHEDAERFVAEARAARVLGGDVVQDGFGAVEHVEDGGDGRVGGLRGGGRDGRVLHAVGEGEDEGLEEGVGRGRFEEVVVLWREDAADGLLERPGGSARGIVAAAAGGGGARGGYGRR